MVECMVRELEIARSRVCDAEKMVAELRNATLAAEELRPLLRQRKCMTIDIESLCGEVEANVNAAAFRALRKNIAAQASYIGLLEDLLAEEAGVCFEDDGTVTQEE